MADERFQDFPQKTNPSGSDELVGVDGSGYFRSPVSSLPSGGGGSSTTFFDTYLDSNENIAVVAFGDSNMYGSLQNTPDFWQLKELTNVYLWQPDLVNDGSPTDPSTCSWKQMGVDFTLLNPQQVLRSPTSVGCTLGQPSGAPTIPFQNIGLAMAVAIAERNPNRNVYLYEASAPAQTTDFWLSVSSTGLPGDGYNTLNDSTYGLAPAFAAMPGFDESTRKVDAVFNCNGSNDATAWRAHVPQGVGGQKFVDNVKQTREVDFPILNAQLYFHSEPMIPDDLAEAGRGGIAPAGSPTYYQREWSGIRDLVAQSGARDYVVSPNQLPGGSWKGSTSDYAHFTGDALGYIGFVAGNSACDGPRVRPDRIRPYDFIRYGDNEIIRQYGPSGDVLSYWSSLDLASKTFETTTSGDSYGTEPVGCYLSGTATKMSNMISSNYSLMRGAAQIETGSTNSGLAQMFLRGGPYVFADSSPMRCCFRAQPIQLAPNDDTSNRYVMRIGYIREQYNDAYVAFEARWGQTNWIACYRGTSGVTEVDTGVLVTAWINWTSLLAPAFEIQYDPTTQDFTFWIDRVQVAQINLSAQTMGNLSDFGISIEKTEGNTSMLAYADTMFFELTEYEGFVRDVSEFLFPPVPT